MTRANCRAVTAKDASLCESVPDFFASDSMARRGVCLFTCSRNIGGGDRLSLPAGAQIVRCQFGVLTACRSDGRDYGSYDGLGKVWICLASTELASFDSARTKTLARWG
jgi:hypothetical protein